MKLVIRKFIATLLLSATISTLAQEAEINAELAQSCQTLVAEEQLSFDFSRQQRELVPQSLPANAEVGNLQFKRLPIFNPHDPKENNWLFLGFNRLHVETKEQTLSQQLLIQPGDPYQPRLIEESERLLRKNTYLYDAQVFPHRICGNAVDLWVLTRDVWTLTPGISLGRAGGVNTSGLSLSDSNLMGWGKRVGVARRDGVDRKGWQIEYRDPNVLGSRWTLDLLYADNDDGRLEKYSLQRPFYALDTRWRFGLNVLQDERVDKLYERGDSVSEFRTTENQYQISGGYSPGLERGKTIRYGLGFEWYESQYEPEPGEVVPDPFPENRTVNQLWFSHEVIKERFAKTNNLNQIYRTEDINLGPQWRLKLGWADEAWGSDRDRLLYDLNYENAWQISGTDLLLYELELNGGWDTEQDASDDIQLDTRLRYYHESDPNSGTFAELSLGYIRNPAGREQLLLGGEENLRGYPLRYQHGDRRFLLTLEKRYYSQKHWWRLFRSGAAVFLDVGRAWFPGESSGDATGVLSNVGFGLRFASSRAETRRILHVDVAFPLRRPDDVDSVQILFKGKQEF